MAGDALELTEDAWHDFYAGAPADGSAWAAPDARRVMRGGSWASAPKRLQAARRFRNDPDYRASVVGFSLARP